MGSDLTEPQKEAVRRALTCLLNSAVPRGRAEYESLLQSVADTLGVEFDAWPEASGHPAPDGEA